MGTHPDPVGAQLQHGEVGKSGEALHLGQFVLNQKQLLQTHQTLDMLNTRDVVE